MSKRITTSREMVATKNKSNVLSCSTPEHRADSPSRDSDSICDSEAASPVPFLCTQDGAEGLTDVVWNFYTPKSENAVKSRQNSSPVSRKAKRSLRPKLIEKQVPKRRPYKATQKRNELFQELMELNENLHELIAKKTQNITEIPQSGSEDDIFNDSPDHSPKGTVRSKNCLRKNVLSSKFTKPDTDTALDSDDSMNECLIKASQVVEEKMYEPTSIKRPRYDSNANNKLVKSDIIFKMDQDSMDAILNSIKLESPIINSAKKFGSQLNNDSFDSLLGNLNDSALDRLTQMPAKIDKSMNKSKLNTSKDGTNWTVNEIMVNDGSPSSKSFFGRHNSMPESPSVPVNKPSTSGMVFGRYSSMPYENNDEHNTEPSDSPIRCTPDEIKKKHQLAREKLMAKRLLPFTSSQKTISPSSLQTHNHSNSQQTILLKKDQEVLLKVVPENGIKKFQPRVASTVGNIQLSQKPSLETNFEQKSNTSDIKSIIEKKRQDALMRLRRRQVHSKII